MKTTGPARHRRQGPVPRMRAPVPSTQPTDCRDRRGVRRTPEIQPALAGTVSSCGRPDMPVNARGVHAPPPAKRPRAALDIGCGCSGRLIALVAGHGLAVEGLDISRRMIEHARMRHPAVTFHHADICAWQLPKQYDLISAWDSLWHVPLADQEARHRSRRAPEVTLLPGREATAARMSSPACCTPPSSGAAPPTCPRSGSVAAGS
jgi:SAM-dependent methyltransferase